MPESKASHDLSHHNNGRIAGIVIYIFKTEVYRFPFITVQYLQTVAGSIEGGFQKIEVDR